MFFTDSDIVTHPTPFPPVSRPTLSLIVSVKSRFIFDFYTKVLPIVCNKNRANIGRGSGEDRQQRDGLYASLNITQ